MYHKHGTPNHQGHLALLCPPPPCALLLLSYLLFSPFQVYRSAEHFLEVLKSLSSSLTDMPLPSYDPSGGDDHPFDVSQVLPPALLCFLIQRQQ